MVRVRFTLGSLLLALLDLNRVIEMRPELVYPIEARAEVRTAPGDDEGAAADRAELARRSDDIWAWVDRYRY